LQLLRTWGQKKQMGTVGRGELKKRKRKGKEEAETTSVSFAVV